MTDRKTHKFAIVNMFQRELPHSTLGDYLIVFDLDSYRNSILIRSMRQANEQVVTATNRESTTSFDDWCPIIISKAIAEEFFNESELPTCLEASIIQKPWRKLRRLRSRETLVKKSTMNITPLTFWWCMRLQSGSHYYETPRLSVWLLEKEDD